MIKEIRESGRVRKVGGKGRKRKEREDIQELQITIK